MKKSKDELLISRLLAIIDNLPFEAWFKDNDGKYQVVNKYIEGDLELPRSEIEGKSDHELYPKHLADKYVGTDSEIIAGRLKGYYNSEYKDNVYEEFKMPCYDESGQLIGITGFSKEITQFVETQNALIESERSKSVLLSKLPGLAYRSQNDAELSMIYISEGCYKLTGYTSEELLNKQPSYYDLIPPDYRADLFEKWSKYIDLNLIIADEYPIITASGETKWVWEKSQEVYDSKQNVIATEGLIIDITERKLAETALRRSEERFRTMFEEAPLGMGIFDSVTGEAYEVNARLAEIIGRSIEEALMINWMKYSHPDDLEEYFKKLELLNSNKLTAFSMDKRYIKPDGSIVWVNVTVAPFKNEDYANTRHLCMVEDITERKQKQEEILYLSYYDQLTGLYNRRFYEEELKRLDTPRNLPITLVMADLNGLKLTNDAFGHTVGDQLLIKFAEIIKRVCRTDDIVARIGGDEFVILLPKTDSKDAEEIIERINHTISSERINHIVCSASFGFDTKRKVTEDIQKIFIYAEDQMYKHKLYESTTIRNETLEIIVKALYEKNEKEQAHCERVSQLCEEIGKALRMKTEDLSELRRAGLLHDIGLIGIDDNLLNKSGGLTISETESIMRHPEIGYQILRSMNQFTPIAEFILYHHERVDGQGYPRKLKGNEIPLQSKIISIADAYDAMTNERSYKKVYSKSEAIEEIRNNAGTQFDNSIAATFIEKVLKRA